MNALEMLIKNTPTIDDTGAVDNDEVKVNQASSDASADKQH
uniref:Uncharacterized protein n=1 Tax=Peronospora matthiolae TaxID=2874970 RepID=A0AAV1VC25_9STRA